MKTLFFILLTTLILQSCCNCNKPFRPVKLVIDYDTYYTLIADTTMGDYNGEMLFEHYDLDSVIIDCNKNGYTIVSSEDITCK